jgi:subtilisin family serine protease
VTVEDDGAGSTINAFPSNSAGPTLQGHPGAAGAAAVGAAFYLATPACDITPAQLEYFSSAGGNPILFDVAGTRLATPVIRQKPDFVGPDGGNDTFLGFTLASEKISVNTTIAGCQNNAGYPNFFGTSAATPHVASIAALMLQANPAATPAQIYQALRTSAAPMGASPNFASGYGFVQADAAMGLIPQVVPAAPTVTSAASSIVIGSSTTITWSSVNATGCTASGSWSGAQKSNGTQSVTPTTAGTDSYTLTCANATGSSPASSATLMVTPKPSSGGGGGTLDFLALLGLSGIGFARILRLWPRVLT